MIEDEKIVGWGCGCGWWLWLWLLCVTHELSTTTEGSVKPRSAGATANVDRGRVSDGGCCCCCCCSIASYTLVFFYFHLIIIALTHFPDSTCELRYRLSILSECLRAKMIYSKCVQFSSKSRR
ncbi:hypothetical protein ARMSODRAFT_349560 [Armillaria solidipes]|uniref:Uncharacterized protein n=1 Tax=Armillaria solidipes TaxID=1076256 RepID=A0A2H3BC73_9AGAR|nr:hypothetical protein ARMSODRAFT_349560 [Armillaria solidipes]